MPLPDLFENIFGPFPDAFLLTEKFAHGALRPVLNEFEMFYKGTQVGFDTTEKQKGIESYDEHDWVRHNQDDEDKVIGFGVLEIGAENDEWLSDQGRKCLYDEVRRHDKMMHQHNRGLRNAMLKARKGSIEQLFRDNPKIRLKVRISFVKLMYARFLMPGRGEDSESLMQLLVRAKHSDCTYEIRSYLPGTFHLSRNFDERYRLRAAIQHLIDTDPNQTPIQRRTVDWVVTRYLEEPNIHNPVNMIAHLNPRDYGPGCENEPRQRRHINRTTVISHFARQAEWLLAYQLAGRTRNVATELLDVRSLIRFCEDTHETRRLATSTKEQASAGRWGLLYYEDKPLEGPLATRMSTVYGHSPKYWKRRLKAAQKAAPAKTRPAPERPTTQVRVRVEHLYDSDFTEATTEDELTTDSDGSHADTNYRSLPIPVPFFSPPEIINGRTSWKCSECLYSFDLLDLEPPELALLPPEVKRVIQSKEWCIQDTVPQWVVYEIVSKHREWHLDRLREQVSQNGAGSQQRHQEYTWKSKERLRSGRNSKQGSTGIKIEDQDVRMDVAV